MSALLITEMGYVCIYTSYDNAPYNIPNIRMLFVTITQSELCLGEHQHVRVALQSPRMQGDKILGRDFNRLQERAAHVRVW
jgi:hypothetical protein